MNFDEWYSIAHPKPAGGSAAKVRAWESRRRTCFAAFNAGAAYGSDVARKPTSAVGEQPAPPVGQTAPFVSGFRETTVSASSPPQRMTWQRIFGYPDSLVPSAADVAARYSVLLAEGKISGAVLRIAYLQAKLDCGAIDT